MTYTGNMQTAIDTVVSHVLEPDILKGAGCRRYWFDNSLLRGRALQVHN
jgi:hypothetical protein